MRLTDNYGNRLAEPTTTDPTGLANLSQAVTIAAKARLAAIEAAFEADDAEREHGLGIIELFLDPEDPAVPTEGAQFVAHGSNEAQRKERRELWAATHDRRDLRAKMDDAKRRKAETAAELEYVRDLLSLAKRTVDWLIAMAQPDVTVGIERYTAREDSR